MADLLGGIRKWGGNLLEAMHDYGTMQYRPPSLPGAEELAGDDAAALQELYDRQFRVARDQAIKNQGAQWFNMDDYGHVGATPSYVTGLQNAITNATTLRGRRDDDTRRAALAKHINTLAGLEPEDEGYLSPAERDFLLAAGPDIQQQVLQKHLFPQQLNPGATAGILQYVNSNDGYIYAMPKDGGPPVNTGVKWDQSTAKIREFGQLAGDPEYEKFLYTQKFAERYGAEAAQVQSEAEAKLPGVVQGMTSAISRLENVRDRLAELPSGRIEGWMREQFDAEFQAVAAILNEAALENIAALADRGVRLNPITEKELELLMSTSAQLKNEPAANVEILQRRIDEFTTRLNNAIELLQWIDSGKPVLSYRPQAYRDRQGVQQPPPPGTIPIGKSED